jgi:hypothetical protein
MSLPAQPPPHFLRGRIGAGATASLIINSTFGLVAAAASFGLASRAPSHAPATGAPMDYIHLRANARQSASSVCYSFASFGLVAATW